MSATPDASAEAILTPPIPHDDQLQGDDTSMLASMGGPQSPCPAPPACQEVEGRHLPVPIQTPDGGWSARSWDSAVQATHGHWRQSWRWGEYMRRQGWRVERIHTAGPSGAGLAQVLFKHWGPVSLAHIPRGPVLVGDAEAVLRELLAAVDAACRRHHALGLLIEPDRPLPRVVTDGGWGLVRSPEPRSPSRTVKVPLLDDRALLARMHHKTRYYVRLAQRRGVVIEQAAGDEAALATFYRLVQDTARRNHFAIGPRATYDTVLRSFGGDAVVLFALVDGVAVAGELLVHAGEDAIALHAASSTTRRVPGATALLVFEAMRWARGQGCRWYDADGIAGEGRPCLAPGSERVPGSSGGDLRGLDWFKLGFGGEIVSYPAPLERRYHLLALWLLRRSRPARAAVGRRARSWLGRGGPPPADRLG